MKFTEKQKHLYNNQLSEPLFHYKNPTTGKDNFGIVRIKTTMVNITVSLRPLLEAGLIEFTEDEVYIDLPSYNLRNVKCNIILIKEKQDDKN